MKKEHMLVIVLVAMVLGGVFWFIGSHLARDKSGGFGGGVKGPVTETVTSMVTDTAATVLDHAGIDWNDYTSGLAQARNQGENVFLYFYTQWCTYCTKLRQTTFLDERVQSYLDDHFISISVDTDQNQALSRSWQVKGLPTMWFLTPEGHRISSLPGYVDGSQLFQILRYIHTRNYDIMSFQDFVKQ